jgi:hypothetical protein
MRFERLHSCQGAAGTDNLANVLVRDRLT